MNHFSCQKTRINGETERQKDRKAVAIPCVALAYMQSHCKNGVME